MGSKIKTFVVGEKVWFTKRIYRNYVSDTEKVIGVKFVYGIIISIFPEEDVQFPITIQYVDYKGRRYSRVGFHSSELIRLKNKK